MKQGCQRPLQPFNCLVCYFTLQSSFITLKRFLCVGWVSPRIPNGQYSQSFLWIGLIQTSSLSPGCTTWSTAEILSDSRPHHGDRKRCIVKDGMTSHALCCHAPSLECHLLETISADKDEVNILFRLKCLKTFPQPFTLSHCRCSLAGRGVLSLWLDYDRLQCRLSGLCHLGTRC